MAWCVPSSIAPIFEAITDELVFRAANCSVTVDHFMITCTMPQGVGSSLQWFVVVDGLLSSVPHSSYRPPLVYNVTSAGSLSTLGGDALYISGYNFGPVIGAVEVHLSIVATGRNGTSVGTPSSARSVSAQNCTFVTPHTQLVCRAPAGSGTVAAATVTVLDQSSTALVSGVSYALPVVDRIDPGVWSADMRVPFVITGT